MKKFSILILIVAIILGVLYWRSEKKEEETPVTQEEKSYILREFECIGQKASDFNCYREYYSNLVNSEGTPEVFRDLRVRYEQNSYVSSQCHQIVHVIGYETSKKFENVADAYKEGDSFCWSGYYHGVLEGVIGRIGYDNLLTEINGICKPLAEVRRYSFDHYNCVHGLGHGIMALEDDELFKSLDTCNLLSDNWERTSCWSGAFMENVMMDSRYHTAKYLKPTDPLYPCNAVDEKYKNTCYLMQTSYMLTLVDSNFEKVFDLCSTVEKDYRNTCYQSLGRDASGRSTSNVAETKEWCYLGEDNIQRENCIIGAVKDFISYLHSDVRAKELCLALDEKALQDVCYSTVESYYKLL